MNEELRALAEKATPGPWRSFTEFSKSGQVVGGGVYVGTPAEMGVTVCTVPDPLSQDAAFIAAARNEVPGLLADIRALRDALWGIRTHERNANGAPCWCPDVIEPDWHTSACAEALDAYGRVR